MAKEYRSVRDIVGPLVLVEGVRGATYGELVDVTFPTGQRSRGTVLEVDKAYAVVQVFEGTQGLSPTGTRVRFSGRSMTLGVSPDLLGPILT